MYYRLAGDEVVGMLSAMSRVGEAYVAEVERIVRLYFAAKDELEPVPAKEVLDRARKGLVTILDVRPPEEYAAGHVPGAMNIPVHQLEKRLGELPKRKRSRRILSRTVLPHVVRRSGDAPEEGPARGGSRTAYPNGGRRPAGVSRLERPQVKAA